MFVIGALIFAISTAGFFLFLHRRLAVPMEFVPAIYCVSCVCFLFFAGILNLLPEMTWCLAGAGVILFLRLWRGIGKLSKRSWIVLTCYALALVYGAYLLVKVPLSHYDDFSHWGLVIREMLKDDRFPNFSNTLIEFQAYPLGSALWVYYVCRLTGGGEGRFLLESGRKIDFWSFPHWVMCSLRSSPGPELPICWWTVCCRLRRLPCLPYSAVHR